MKPLVGAIVVRGARGIAAAAATADAAAAIASAGKTMYAVSNAASSAGHDIKHQRKVASIERAVMAGSGD
jgi:hypothetical protein